MLDSSKEQLIIKTAQELFARFGFKKTTMDEIAQKAHIGKSTIYHYFESKEELFRTIVEKESHILFQKIEEAVSKAPGAQEKLRAYVITRMQHLKEMANFYSVLSEEYLEHYAFIEKVRQQDFQRETEMVRAILKEGVEAGIFYVEDIPLTGFAIITALKGLEYPFAVSVELPDIQKQVDILLKVLFNGVLIR